MYLIAAEADVGLGNAAEAATFINVLHQRAASPAHKNDYNVTAGQMTLDYIMEERERELAGEHNRWYDMVRPGAQFFVDRVKKYNPHAARERRGQVCAAPDSAVADRRRDRRSEVSAERGVLTSFSM